eukprot:TRINITY_DN3085_c0_g1_i3.p1 TRINITY_DN3085_c0_g1~~TRINITY_DN3085_c0_g1_i3.p1  ORF type:complete len:352 (-),score=63.46 TRINITY_DN3085_c0_g1_i3:324-1379(-)
MHPNLIIDTEVLLSDMSQFRTGVKRKHDHVTCFCQQNHPNKLFKTDSGAKVDPETPERQVICFDIKSRFECLIMCLKNGVDRTVQCESANQLRLFSQIESNRVLIARLGGLEALVALLKNTTDINLQRHVIGAIWNLCVNGDNNTRLVELDVIDPLVKALSSPEDKVQRVAAGALRCLSWNNEENRIKLASSGAIVPLFKLLESSNIEIQEQSMAAIWNLSLSSENSRVMSNKEYIEIIIKLMNTSNDELRRLAAGILRSLAYLYEPNRTIIAELGGIQCLCSLLNSQNYEVKKQVAAALGNLTYGSSPNRMAVAENNGILPIIDLLYSTDNEIQLIAIKTIRNLALDRVL